MVLAGTMLMSSVQRVQALTMKECSAKYQAAKAAGTLAGRHRPANLRPGNEAKARGKCRVSNGDLAEIFERVGGKGSNAHLPGSIQRQQGSQW